MRVSKNKLIMTAGLLLMGAGGWSVYDSLNKQDDEVAIVEVVDITALSSDIEVIDESNRTKAIVGVYRNLLEGEYLNTRNELKRAKVEERLAIDTKIFNYPYPTTVKGEKEIEMTALLTELLSRKDGTTNEVDDASYRVIDKSTFQKWEKLFGKWTEGEIDKVEFSTKSDDVLKDIGNSSLSDTTVMTFDFPYTESAIEMMEGVLAEVEKNGGSTAPHVSFVYVEFDEEQALYTLYYAETHIE